MQIPGEGLPLPVEAIQPTAFCSNPERTGLIFVNARYPGATKAFGIVRIVPERLDRRCCWIETEEADEPRSQPEYPRLGRRFIDKADPDIGIDEVRVVVEDRRKRPVGMHPVEAAARTDPEYPGSIFINGLDEIVVQARRVGWVVSEVSEGFGLPVEAVEPAFRRADPQHLRLLRVFEDRPDGSFGSGCWGSPGRAGNG